MKGFAVCGTASGVGKTTVAAGLMAALRRRGLRVRPFKCGPDFIDPGHHARVCGCASHNLDTWLLSPADNKRIFASACRGGEVAIVEGMMGLFDGVRGSGEQGSSAEMAKLLGLPVVLVIDASAAARSVAAVVHGFRTFDPNLRLAGVILNRVAGHHHARLLIEAIGALYPDLPVGWLPSDSQLHLEERHLGLQTAEERSWSTASLDRLISLIEQTVPLNQMLEQCEFELPNAGHQPEPAASPSVRIGIARDRAFCFYYEAALEELRRHGAELVEFSPLADRELPVPLDGLYFGGGYPELYAEALSGNTSMLQQLRSFTERGHPIYGECGGLMFLSRWLRTRDGREWSMAGLLPLAIEMTDKLVHFGYAEVRFIEDGFAPKGDCLKGHSFHYSRIVDEGNVTKKAVARYTLSGEEREEGFTSGKVFGSYIHLHFASAPSIAQRFISMAKARQCEVEA